MPLTKNESIQLEITALSSDGNGFGRYDGQAVFVPFSAVGDVLQVKIVKALANHAFGIIEKIITKSDTRIEQDCAIFQKCGGCSFRHISYHAECRAKEGFVQDAFDRIGKFKTPVQPILPSPEENGYRNKVQLPFTMADDGTVKAGFFAGRSHRVIACESCRLQPDVLNELSNFLCTLFTKYKISVYDEISRKGLLRHLYLRRAHTNGEVMVCLVLNGTSLPHETEITEAVQAKFPAVTSFLLNENKENTNVILGKKYRTVFGNNYITDTLCGVPVKLYAASFFQVNPLGAERLYGVAAEMAQSTQDDILLDLYCGAGTIGLSMVNSCKQLVGVEIIPAAIESAKQNAAEMGVGAKTRFLCADAGAAAQQLAKENLSPDIIVLDPPRKGCDDATLQAVLQMAPKRIVMVSCNAATAARDCQILCDATGYSLQEIRPVDMFPRTKHVETVVLMTRENT